MEPLALLCNLYGSGPATLKRLQRAGCDSLGAMLELEPDELADHLSWSEEDAERFLREGLLLIERLEGRDAFEADVDEPELEEEDDSFADPDGRSGGPLAATHEGEADEDELRAEDEPDEPVEELRLDDEDDDEDDDEAGDGVERHEEFEEVLDAWRDLDRETPPVPPTDEILPQPPPLESPDATPLDSAAIEALSESLMADLRARGILTLEALVAASTLDLARSVGIGFTRVSRLQFLVRRALAGGSELPREAGVPASPGPPAPRTPPSGAGEADRLGASGPFA